MRNVLSNENNAGPHVGPSAKIAWTPADERSKNMNDLNGRGDRI